MQSIHFWCVDDADLGLVKRNIVENILQVGWL